jgi:hypothetical protein
MLPTIEDVLKILAIVIGGVWTYYKFIQGRTLHPLLELKVSGRVIRWDDRIYLICDLEAKNPRVCSARVHYAGLRLHSSSHLYEPQGAIPVIWDRNLLTVPVFENHPEIWPGETLREKVLLRAPLGPRFFKLELRIGRETRLIRWLNKKTPCYAVTIRRFLSQKKIRWYGIRRRLARRRRPRYTESLRWVQDRKKKWWYSAAIIRGLFQKDISWSAETIIEA